MGTIILFGLAIIVGVAVAIAQGSNGSTGGHGHSKNDSSGHSVFGSSNTHRCNGDCDNCPAHYGYRYGRWYYGHGHQHGCVRGGNGGATGRTNRD